MFYVYTGDSVKIIEPSFEIINPRNREEGIVCLQKIERLARISHRSEEMQTPNSWLKFINAVVVGHGDWSVVEHSYATVVFRTDRGISHELVRHRLFSFTQESTRFVNGRKSYPDGLEFIRPINLPFEKMIFEASCIDAEERYLRMLDNGVRPQEARSILPNSFATTIGMTGNLRSWRWLFLARTTVETHPDMRRLMIPLLEEFKKRIPILYDDIEPNLKQSISMGKVH